LYVAGAKGFITLGRARRGRYAKMKVLPRMLLKTNMIKSGVRTGQNVYENTGLIYLGQNVYEKKWTYRIFEGLEADYLLLIRAPKADLVLSPWPL
jgi:hypothetical protein